MEYDPALSPDGKMIAYAWNPEEDQTTAQIFVQMVGGSEPIQITDSLHEAACPAWL